MPVYSDEQLVLEALNDSHQAFGQLIEQYQYRVLRTISSIISDEQAAQDVAQEIFLSAWQDLPKLREKKRFGRWLNRIAINRSKNWLRDRRRYQEHTTAFKDITALTQERRYEADRLRQEVWEAIDELAADHREAVILHYISGYSYKEISEMLAIPLSTTVGRIQQARNQLRKEFLDMVTKLQLEIDSTVHKFLKECAKQNGVSVEGLVIRLIERYKRYIDSPEIAVRKISDDRGRPSPDGRYLAFTHWSRHGDLAVLDLTTGESRDLTDEGSWSSRVHYAGERAWSPDGKQIAYSWISYNEYDEPHELRIVGLDGSESRVLYRDESKETAWLAVRDWSQDGKHILAEFKNLDGASEIVLVLVADGSVRVLKALRNLGLSNSISLSPDGRYVVYARPAEEHNPTGLRDIFLLATDGGGEEVPLVEHPADDYGPAWAPDGKTIVFGSDRSGNYDIWLMQVADGKPVGEPRLVKRDTGQIQPVGVTREGSLYYIVNEPSIRSCYHPSIDDVYTASIDPETGKLLIPPAKAIRQFEGFNGVPAWSPDGKSLAYVSLRPSPGSVRRRRILVIRSEETGEERELYPEVQHAHYLRWSPDGRSILSLWAGGALINMIDAQTGDVTPIVQPNRVDEARIFNFALSSDGKAIFYIRKRSIVERDLETGKEKELCQADGERGLAISPDGQHLAFAKRFDTLMVMPTEGGEPRELLCLQDTDKFAHGSVGSAFAWTANGRYVLFRKQRRQKSNPSYSTIELWRISVEGGEPQKLLEMEGLRDISVHPDGQRIAFTVSERSAVQGTWVMENFLPGFTAAK